MKFLAVLQLSTAIFVTIILVDAQNAPDCGIQKVSKQSSSSSPASSSSGTPLGIIGGVETEPHE